LEIQVCHFPPGTSKWNKIEHRMFCHITNNWRGRPLLSRQDEAGIKVSGAELAAVVIERDEFHGEWNYRVSPRYSHRNR
jgi:hypothetical protein